MTHSQAVKIDYENLFKRLLVLNHHGIYLRGADGHIWIETDENHEYPIILKSVVVNNKIYGGIIEAIDVMDEALRMDGNKSLMEAWEDLGEFVLFLGKGGADDSRLKKVKEGNGGIY